LRPFRKGLDAGCGDDEDFHARRCPATDTTDLQAAPVIVDLLRVARIFVGMTVKEILAQLKSLGESTTRRPARPTTSSA
jgi:hypothetical protein